MKSYFVRQKAAVIAGSWSLGTPRRVRGQAREPARHRDHARLGGHRARAEDQGIRQRLRAERLHAGALSDRGEEYEVLYFTPNNEKVGKDTVPWKTADAARVRREQAGREGLAGLGQHRDGEPYRAEETIACRQ